MMTSGQRKSITPKGGFLFTLSDAWVRICGVCALAIAFCMTFWCVRRKKESES